MHFRQDFHGFVKMLEHRKRMLSIALCCRNALALSQTNCMQHWTHSSKWRLDERQTNVKMKFSKMVKVPIISEQSCNNILFQLFQNQINIQAKFIEHTWMTYYFSGKGKVCNFERTMYRKNADQREGELKSEEKKFYVIYVYSLTLNKKIFHGLITDKPT